MVLSERKHVAKLFVYYDPNYIKYVAQTVKNLPAMQETWIWLLGQEDSLDNEMATHSSNLAWEIPWIEAHGGLQSMELQRVWHNWATNTWRKNLKHSDSTVFATFTFSIKEKQKGIFLSLKMKKNYYGFIYPLHIISVLYRAHLCMKCSLGISNFLEEISSLSHYIVFLYFFALIAEEGFLISPCYSLELCIQMGISFLFSFAFHFFSQLFVRPPQTAILLFCISIQKWYGPNRSRRY